MKAIKIKLISILVCIMLIVVCMTVGIFAAENVQKIFSANGLVSFTTSNIEGEIVGQVGGYGHITGYSTYSGFFAAGNQTQTTKPDGTTTIGSALKPWEMGTISFVKDKNVLVDIVIQITIKNRGDSGILINFNPPSQIDGINIRYSQALTNKATIEDEDWVVTEQASQIGKIVSDRTEEDIVVAKGQYYTFKMTISLASEETELPDDGVNLSFAFELNADLT